MPYGKYNPAKSEKIINSRGETTIINTPEGYSGLFWGKVYCDDVEIQNAEDYFLKITGSDEHLEFDYWDQISDIIEQHCTKYIFPYVKDHYNYHYQSGFGGDECDGLIDFWLPVPIPKMPDIVFKIQGKIYQLRWTFSSGE